MKLTTKDIAKICGVSRGSVDRALNDRPGINQETKEKIIRVAEELGYRPHLLARSLVTGKTMSIGLILFDLEHRFLSQMAMTIFHRAKMKGYFTYISLTEKNKDEEIRNIERLAGLRVDGFIILTVNKGREFERFLTRLHRPVVTVGNMVSNRWPFVSIDDRQAIIDSIDLIVSKEYRKIIYLAPPLSTPADVNLYAQEQRLLGYKAGLKKHPELGRPIVVKDKNYLDIIESMEYNNRERTAIMCSSDIYALRVLDRLSARGLLIPRDVGLIGFDNIDTLEHVRPRLATVDFHIGEIGEKAVDALLHMIRGEEVERRIMIDHVIIPGETL
jgi:LacI family transcriptional regulator